MHLFFRLFFFLILCLIHVVRDHGSYVLVRTHDPEDIVLLKEHVGIRHDDGKAAGLKSQDTHLIPAVDAALTYALVAEAFVTSKPERTDSESVRSIRISGIHELFERPQRSRLLETIQHIEVQEGLLLSYAKQLIPHLYDRIGMRKQNLLVTFKYLSDLNNVYVIPASQSVSLSFLPM